MIARTRSVLVLVEARSSLGGFAGQLTASDVDAISALHGEVYVRNRNEVMPGGGRAVVSRAPK